MDSKKNIKEFGKKYQYLLDPELRKKEAGTELLMLDGAEIGDVEFQGQTWRNIKFSKCDFVGAYQIKLAALEDCAFEDCRFSGVISWGIAKNVSYLRCGVAGESNVLDFSGSSNTRFDDCQFVGTKADPNQWGAIGSRGDATFVGCTAKWFALVGYKQATLQACEMTEITVGTDSKANSGESHARSSVMIQNSKLRGNFDMTATSLQSVTVRDTTIDSMNLSNASVMGDIVMERVTGTSVDAGVTQVGRFVLRDCTFAGGNGYAFRTAVQGAESLLIERCSLSSVSGKGVALGAGRPLDASEWSVVRRNKSTTILNCKIPNLDASWFETQQLHIEGCDFERADLSNARIEVLEVGATRFNMALEMRDTQLGAMAFNATTFAGALDLTNTSVKDFRQSGGTDIEKLGENLRTGGSNIKLPRR